jgi:hypothetical protein
MNERIPRHCRPNRVSLLEPGIPNCSLPDAMTRALQTGEHSVLPTEVLSM